MRKLAFALMISVILLGCSNNSEEPDLHEFYGDITQANMEAIIRSDHGDRIVEFAVRYELTTNSELVTILEPTELSGVAVTLSQDGNSIEFDGLTLETGTLPATRLSPLWAVPFAMRAWREGHIETSGVSGGDVSAVFMSTYEGVSHEIVSVFDAESLKPKRTEIFADEIRVLEITFRSVEIL